MRFLGILGFGLEVARLVRNVFRAVALGDNLTNLSYRNIRQGHRVSSHIGDQTDVAFARELDTFIELLRNAHRPLRVEAELARRFLLQR